MKTQKRMIAILLTALLALSFLMAACSKGGGTPIGDNTTPGTSSASVGMDSTGGDNTPTGDNLTPGTSPTPNGGDTTPPGASETPTTPKQPKYAMPAYDVKQKAEIDERVGILFGQYADIDKFLEETQKKYGEFLNINITNDVIIVGIATGDSSPHYKSRGENVTGISPAAVEEANALLESNGVEPLDPTDPVQNATLLWIYVSSKYDPDFVGQEICDDIAMPFGLARANPSVQGDAERLSNSFWSYYVNLFGGPFVLEEALK